MPWMASGDGAVADVGGDGGVHGSGEAFDFGHGLDVAGVPVGGVVDGLTAFCLAEAEAVDVDIHAAPACGHDDGDAAGAHGGGGAVDALVGVGLVDEDLHDVGVVAFGGPGDLHGGLFVEGGGVEERRLSGALGDGHSAPVDGALVLVAGFDDGDGAVPEDLFGEGVAGADAEALGVLLEAREELDAAGEACASEELGALGDLSFGLGVFDFGLVGASDDVAFGAFGAHDVAEFTGDLES